MGTIFWNGVPSSSVSVVVEQPPNYRAAERDYETIHIPGRSGDLLVDNESYKNVARPYKIAFGSAQKNHSEMAAAVSEWLHSANGYARLEDTYEPEYYRMAVYKDDIDIVNILDHLGRVTINFDCMPQRFLKSGERTISFINTTSLPKAFTLRNPTGFTAKPLITVFGGDSGDIVINGLRLRILSLNDPVTIDCDLLEAYTGDISHNSFISWPNGERIFPTLKPGLNEMAVSRTVTKVEVIPRWWTL